MQTEPVRIAQIVGKVSTGGVEAVVLNYYRHIDKSKIQFDFIMDGKEPSPFDDEILKAGGRIYRVTPYADNIIKNIKDCCRLFELNNYQIVHSHLNTMSVFPLMAAKMAGVRVRIAHNHSTAAKGEGKTLVKYMLKPFAELFPTHYFACSKYVGEWLFGKGCFDKPNYRIIPNAIDIKKYSYNEFIREKKRRELGLGKKFVVGHIGRFVFQKNHEFVLDIFNAIHKRRKESVLLLVGTGNLQNAVRQKAVALGLGDSVLFLGARFDVNELYQAMDALILPSHYEGLPVVGVEAQAAGLRCYMSDNITSEAKITDLVEFMSLNQSEEQWAERILSAQTLNRKSGDLPSQFDIDISVKYLESLYLKL